MASLELVDTSEARRLALMAVQSSPMPLVIDSHQLPGIAVGATFSPDGQWLALGHLGGQLGVWPGSGGTPVTWSAHQMPARGFFSPDSKTLLSIAPSEPQNKVWSVPELRLLGVQPRTESILKTEIGSSQANHMRKVTRTIRDPSAVGGWNLDRSLVHLGEQLAGGEIPPCALDTDESSLIFALRENLYVASTAETTVSPTLLARCESAVEQVTSHSGSDRLATAHADGTMQLWSLHAGLAEPLRRWPRVVGGACADLRFDPSGRLLVAGFDEGSSFAWGVADPPGSDPLLLSASGSRMTEVEFHPGGAWLATANMSRVSLWPLDRSRYPHVFRGHTGRVESVIFAPDGASLFSRSTDGTIRQWPLSPSPDSHARILFDWGHPVDGVIGWAAMSPDGRFLVVAGGENHALLVPLDGSKPRALGDFDQRVNRAAVGPHGWMVVVTGLVDGKRVARLWDLEAGSISDVDLGNPEPAATAWLTNIRFVPTGGLLVADMGQLVMVDPATGLRTKVAEGVGRFTLGREGSLILSQPHLDFNSGYASVHDLTSGTSTILTSHGRGVVGIALDPTATIAVTGGNDGIIRVGPITGETPQWLVGPPGSAVAVAVSPDGRWIASAGDDGTVRLWPMPDLTKPPIHDLPHTEFLARLRSFTNLRVVRHPEDPDGHMIRAAPFPGWQIAPEW